MENGILVPIGSHDPIESLINSIEKDIDGYSYKLTNHREPQLSTLSTNNSSHHNGTAGIFANGTFSFWSLLNIVSRALHIAPFFALLFIIGCVILLVFCCWFCCWRFSKSKNYHHHSTKDINFKDPLLGFGEEDIENRLGELNFSLVYRPSKSRLEITILYATGIPANGNDLPDSFVEVEVLDVDAYEKSERLEIESGLYPGRLDLTDKKKKKTMKTKTIPDDVSPVWNETVGVKIPLIEISRQVIRFLVFNYDPTTSRSNRIGEVLVYLREFPAEAYVGSVLETKRYIKPTSPEKGDGDLCVMLMSRQTIHKNFVKVTLLEGRNLAVSRKNVIEGARIYAEFVLYHYKQKLQRRTSPVIACISEHPYFNHVEEFSFSINKTFETVSVKITLYLYKSKTSVVTKKLGSIRLGTSTCSSHSGEDLHWRQMSMKHQMNKPIARWHAL